MNYGNIVEMYCDMNKLEMSFIVNVVAHKDIDETEYTVALNLYNVGDSITVLD